MLSQVHLSIILLLVAAIAAYLVFYCKPIEGFDSAGQLFEQGVDAQLGRPQIFITAPVSQQDSRAAMGMPTLLPGLIGTATMVNPDTALINTTDGQNALATQAAQCRAIRSPSSIIRVSGQTISCGWLFPPGLASGFAAIGSAAGPLLSEHQQLIQQSRFTWQWDPVQAQIEEDRRECARITSCTSIAGTGCGWCTTSNKAVPVNPDGSLKYAAAAPCATNPITNYSQCPVAPVTPRIVGPGASAASTQPAADGSCGPGCIRDAVIMKGCDIGGALASALAAGTAVTTLPQIQDLASRNFMLGSKILSGATVTQTEALAEAGQLVTGRTSGDKVVARAATSLCTGGIPYDVCSASEDGTVVPRPDCLKQIWSAAGCGPRGTGFSQLGAATSSTAAKQTVAGIVAGMSSADSTTQQNAIQACLGAALVRPPAPTCTEPGVEVIYYDYVGGSPNTMGPLEGREIVSEGFPNFDVGGGYVLRSGRTDRVQLKIIGRIQPPIGQGGMQDIRVRSDDGIAVTVNGIRVINGWQDQGATIYQRTAALNADSGSSQQLMVDWYEDYGDAVMQLWIAPTGTGAFIEIPQNWLFLTQTRMTAFLVWRFYSGDSITEIRGLSATAATGPLTFVGSGTEGQRAVTFNGGPNIMFQQMLPLNQITAIALNLYLEPVQPAAPNQHGLVLLELGTPASGLLTVHYVAGGWRVMYSGTGSPTILNAAGAQLGQWTRIVFVVADDSKSATLYVGGKVVATVVGSWAMSSGPTTGMMGASSLTPARANYRCSVFAIYDYGIDPSMLMAGAKE